MEPYPEEYAYGVAAFFLMRSLLRELERNQVLAEQDVAFLIREARNIMLIAAGSRRQQGDEEGSQLFEDAANVIDAYKSNPGS